MIFQHTIDKVLSGEKTQTRRIVKQDETLNRWGLDGENDTRINEVIAPRSKPLKWGYTLRNVYLVGKTYAVQPARGKPAVARILLTGIWQEDVRCISLDDAHAEGFADEFEFMRVWVAMHDKQIHKQQYWGMKSIMDRPAERYQVWVLTFKLVQA